MVCFCLSNSVQVLLHLDFNGRPWDTEKLSGRLSHVTVGMIGGIRFIFGPAFNENDLKL